MTRLQPSCYPIFYLTGKNNLLHNLHSTHIISVISFRSPYEQMCDTKIVIYFFLLAECRRSVYPDQIGASRTLSIAKMSVAGPLVRESAGRVR